MIRRRNSEKCDDRPLHAIVVTYLILAFERDPSEVLDPNVSQDTVVALLLWTNLDAYMYMY